MRFLSDWSLEAVDTDRLVLNAGDRKVAVFVFGETLFRIFVHRHDTPRPTRTWSIDPDGTLAWEGRERLSGEGFTPPAWRLTEHEDGISVESERLKLVIARPFKLTWYARTDGEWTPIAEDRPTGGVAVARRGNGVEHYLRRYDDERYYGLGEKSGDLERSGRRFEMRTLDAMGYRAETTDPLYKHVPFTITRRSDGLAYGLFYDNLATSRIDLGNELDNYHAPYRAFRAEDGDLDLWFLLGERVLDVVKEFTRLTGGVAFGPKWSFGYSGSTMHYTDAPNAQERLGEFIALCREHDIPCDSFQLSSGYSSIGDKRYVFTWNRDKVPDPAAMVRTFREAGMHLIANIKPCLLTDHPAYDDAAEKRLFVTDSDTGEAEVSPFWDANGSHLDFTRQATVDWWKSNVDAKLLALGIDSTWNDNNEFEIVDREAQLAGFGDPLPASVAKPVLSLLMVRASQEAQLAHAPSRRPFLITRSGGPGLQRYAQTWSGDNRTEWPTLRYNQRMGLGLALSGISNVGHDVGGFSGPRPDPELFVRWVQNGVMHPRFTIHSWNDDGTVNEPWMYPEVLDAVRDAIRLRYRLLPYLYTVAWRAHAELEPMIRPTFLDHEDDPATFEENDEFLLGEELLVATVVEPGARTRQLHLPDNGCGWYAFEGGAWLAGGRELVVDAPLEHLPLFVRAGGIVATSDRLAHVDPAQDDVRALRIYPFVESGSRTVLLFDDDGESTLGEGGGTLVTHVTLSCDAKAIRLDWQHEGDYRPAYQGFRIELPTGDPRPLYVNGCKVAPGESCPL